MKKRILIALKVIVSVSVLGYLFNKMDFEGARPIHGLTCRDIENGGFRIDSIILCRA